MVAAVSYRRLRSLQSLLEHRQTIILGCCTAHPTSVVGQFLPRPAMAGAAEILLIVDTKVDYWRGRFGLFADNPPIISQNSSKKSRRRTDAFQSVVANWFALTAGFGFPPPWSLDEFATRFQ